MSDVYTVSDDTFDVAVLQSELPVLLDIWAPWCGPCKMIAPVVAEIAQVYAGRLKVCKLDADSNKGKLPAYNIRSVPTLLVFKSGNVVATHVGMCSRGQLQALIDKAL